jgi:hypothetical protein
LYGVREWEEACFVAKLKVLFLIILEKVTREMEGYYKLVANVGSGRGQLEINVRHLLEVLEKICGHNIIVHVQNFTFVGNVLQRFAIVSEEI